MLLLKSFERRMKTVNYFGLVLDVPEEVKFIATDADGTVCYYYASESKPYISDHEECWKPQTNWDYLAEVDLEGQDWRKTLMEV